MKLLVTETGLDEQGSKVNSEPWKAWKAWKNGAPGHQNPDLAEAGQMTQLTLEQCCSLWGG